MTDRLFFSHFLIWIQLVQRDNFSTCSHVSHHPSSHRQVIGKETYAMMGINLEVMLQEMRASADVLPAVSWLVTPGESAGTRLFTRNSWEDHWWRMRNELRISGLVFFPCWKFTGGVSNKFPAVVSLHNLRYLRCWGSERAGRLHAVALATFCSFVVAKGKAKPGHHLLFSAKNCLALKVWRTQ